MSKNSECQRCRSLHPSIWRENRQVTGRIQSGKTAYRIRPIHSKFDSMLTRYFTTQHINITSANVCAKYVPPYRYLYYRNLFTNCTQACTWSGTAHFHLKTKKGNDVYRITKVQSRNRSCSGKAIIITYSECVPVASVIQHSKHMGRIKADSHIPCRTHAVPLPCRSLIHTCHAAPQPCSYSAVSFVKVRMVAGNIRTASPAVYRSSFL
jgi:hypothetical protein